VLVVEEEQDNLLLAPKNKKKDNVKQWSIATRTGQSSLGP
jgi:hypothetical protein